MSVKISGVEKKSPAARAGIKAGDTLIKIGDNEIVDVLDYRFYQNDERLFLTVLRKNGKEKVLIMWTGYLQGWTVLVNW